MWLPGFAGVEEKGTRSVIRYMNMVTIQHGNYIVNNTVLYTQNLFRSQVFSPQTQKMVTM